MNPGQMKIVEKFLETTIPNSNYDMPKSMNHKGKSPDNRFGSLAQKSIGHQDTAHLMKKMKHLESQLKSLDDEYEFMKEENEDLLEQNAKHRDMIKKLVSDSNDPVMPLDRNESMDMYDGIDYNTGKNL